MGKKNLMKALREVFNPELSPNKGKKLHRRVMLLTDGAIEIHDLLAVKQLIKCEPETSLHTFGFGNEPVAKEIAVAGSGQHTMYNSADSR